MLVLTRREGEVLTIGEDIKIVIVQVKGKQIRLGIEAPEDVFVLREEAKKKTKEKLLLKSEAI